MGAVNGHPRIAINLNVLHVTHYLRLGWPRRWQLGCGSLQCYWYELIRTLLQLLGLLIKNSHRETGRWCHLANAYENSESAPSLYIDVQCIATSTGIIGVNTGGTRGTRPPKNHSAGDANVIRPPVST